MLALLFDQHDVVHIHPVVADRIDGLNGDLAFAGGNFDVGDGDENPSTLA